MLNAAILGGHAASPPAETVVYKLRDCSMQMVEAWQQAFALHTDSVEISQGDIFRDAPAADAIVSPANSFGFMDGGIDMAYSQHFGWQLMQRLQKEIKTKKDGEVLVGDALIIPIYGDREVEEEMRTKVKKDRKLASCNEGKLIQYLISAPTMRTPQNVSNTVNAYLAFRAVILAVKRHNADGSKQPIRSVLCPGLGTAVGKMPKPICAKQMLLAYETYHLEGHSFRRNPEKLETVYLDEQNMKVVDVNKD